MKNQLLAFFIASVTQLAFPNTNFAQAPNLGTAANFVLFTPTGAVGNTGISQITGNVGTNSGAITGFGNVNGVMHNADATTVQAGIDLLAAAYYLDTLSLTDTIGPVLGNGDTLLAGVDTIFAAGSIVGILTLDAQGDSSAVFIIKIGGALTTAASATVNLINGAQACNVFWIAKGAISMAASSTMRGNLISYPGAIDLGDGCILEGRALSTTGSVTVYGTLGYIPTGCSRPMLTGPSAPNLGRLECFALFSSNGIVANTGVTNLTGDAGSNNGSATGYDALLVTGTIHPYPDPYTAQCANNFPRAYNYLDTLPYDIELLYPAQFGNNLVLTPHTYRMNAATVFTDTLYLNAENNPNAIFVIQVTGAFTTSANSKISLINGTQAKNVYWKITGAVTINDYSVFCGTVICNGAIILNTGVSLDGRALTSSGNVNTTTITADNFSDGNCTVLPIKLLSFTADCDKQNVMLKWSTATETNNSYYSIQRSSNGINWLVVGKVPGLGNSSIQQNYSFTDKESYNGVSYYRLRQTDIDGQSETFKIIIINNCRKDHDELDIYPNPAVGIFNLLFRGDKEQFQSVSIYNVSGEKVYCSGNYQSRFDLSDKPNGMYFIYFNLTSGSIVKKFMIKK